MDNTRYVGGRALNTYERRFIQTLDRIIQQGLLKWDYVSSEWMAEQLEKKVAKLRKGSESDDTE